MHYIHSFTFSINIAIYKFRSRLGKSFLQSTSVNNVCKLVQLRGPDSLPRLCRGPHWRLLSPWHPGLIAIKESSLRCQWQPLETIDGPKVPSEAQRDAAPTGLGLSPADIVPQYGGLRATASENLLKFEYWIQYVFADFIMVRQLVTNDSIKFPTSRGDTAPLAHNCGRPWVKLNDLQWWKWAQYARGSGQL